MVIGLRKKKRGAVEKGFQAPFARGEGVCLLSSAGEILRGAAGEKRDKMLRRIKNTEETNHILLCRSKHILCPGKS